MEHSLQHRALRFTLPLSRKDLRVSSLPPHADLSGSVTAAVVTGMTFAATDLRRLTLAILCTEPMVPSGAHRFGGPTPLRDGAIADWSGSSIGGQRASLGDSGLRDLDQGVMPRPVEVDGSPVATRDRTDARQHHLSADPARS